MNYSVRAAGKEVSVVLTENGVTVNGVQVIHGSTVTDNYFEFLINGKRKRAFFLKKDSVSGDVYVDNTAIPVTIEPENIRRAREILGVRSGTAASSVLQVVSPMPGLIAKILVQENSPVAIGDRLCVLEAMKMENELRSTVNGIITKISVKERDTVEKGKVLIEIKLT
ncbi:MAG TPA: biotin/lipoyl-containing protein [Candidatus Kapabacteria bacterium]|nr:biotin/lipoyl-containing protein [Candidatus Kapabacteria bacterium]